MITKALFVHMYIDTNIFSVSYTGLSTFFDLVINIFALTFSLLNLIQFHFLFVKKESGNKKTPFGRELF